MESKNIYLSCVYVFYSGYDQDGDALFESSKALYACF